jgi:hypothetical protein
MKTIIKECLPLACRCVFFSSNYNNSIMAKIDEVLERENTAVMAKKEELILYGVNMFDIQETKDQGKVRGHYLMPGNSDWNPKGSWADDPSVEQEEEKQAAGARGQARGGRRAGHYVRNGATAEIKVDWQQSSFGEQAGPKQASTGC